MLEQWGCTDYKILDEKERNHHFKTPESSWWCDKTGVSYKRSPKWHGDNWYRFLPPAGTKIPEEAPTYQYCGTSASGWLQGSHPINLGETVIRTVCFVWSASKTCHSSYTSQIKVRNCGQFFLYNLVDVKACNLGYCAK